MAHGDELGACAD